MVLVRSSKSLKIRSGAIPSPLGEIWGLFDNETMKGEISRTMIGEELNRVDLLQWGHLCFLVMAIMVELSIGILGLGFLVKLAIVGGLYGLLFKVVQELYYSFWTFAIFAFFYFFFSFGNAAFGHHSFPLAFCYFMAMVLLAGQMYILHSPIYYPLVRWWEYDFRYRDDLKIKVTVGDKEYPGRLTDLRREAGCVALFEKCPTGTRLQIKFEKEENIGTIEAETMSRRCYSLGRPHTYGVKFHLSSEEERTSYHKLASYWKNRKRLIKKLKYAVESDNH